MRIFFQLEYFSTYGIKYVFIICFIYQSIPPPPMKLFLGKVKIKKRYRLSAYESVIFPVSGFGLVKRLLSHKVRSVILLSLKDYIFPLVWKYPNKHLWILVLVPLFLYLVPYLHQFPAVKYITAGKVPFGAIWDKFASYLIQIWYHDLKK